DRAVPRHDRGGHGLRQPRGGRHEWRLARAADLPRLEGVRLDRARRARPEVRRAVPARAGTDDRRRHVVSTAKVEGRAPFLTKSDYTYKELRRRIIEGELAPGTRILLRPMAEQLGLSVMQVRGAIELPARNGLVSP